MLNIRFRFSSTETHTHVSKQKHHTCTAHAHTHTRGKRAGLFQLGLRGPYCRRQNAFIHCFLRNRFPHWSIFFCTFKSRSTFLTSSFYSFMYLCFTGGLFWALSGNVSLILPMEFVISLPYKIDLRRIGRKKANHAFDDNKLVVDTKAKREEEST